MALIRWNPLQELEQFQRRMNDLFEESLFGRMREGDALTAAWSPRVDVFEDDQAVTITAELPGLDTKDVKVHVENNVLTLSGERKLEKEDKRDNYTRIERFYGTFSRSFSLPAAIDQNKVTAKMDKGVLKVTLPKREEAKPKQIEVKVS